MPKATPPVGGGGETRAWESPWGRRKQTLDWPCRRPGPSDARVLSRAHPLPEPPLQQVPLGYMRVHLGGVHAGRWVQGASYPGGAGTVEAGCLGNRQRRLLGACPGRGRGLQRKLRPVQGLPGAPFCSTAPNPGSGEKGALFRPLPQGTSASDRTLSAALGRGTGGAQAWDALPRSASLPPGSGTVVRVVRGSVAGSPPAPRPRATAELFGLRGRARPTRGEWPDGAGAGAVPRGRESKAGGAEVVRLAEKEAR